jgi:hypothetical protein
VVLSEQHLSISDSELIKEMSIYRLPFEPSVLFRLISLDLLYVCILERQRVSSLSETMEFWVEKISYSGKSLLLSLFDIFSSKWFA